MVNADRDRSEEPVGAEQRVQRYAAAIRNAYPRPISESVMAVADAEQAELRAEVERIREERDGAREQRDDLVELVDQLKEGAASAGIHWAQEKRRAEAAERALAEERAESAKLADKVARVEAVARTVLKADDGMVTYEPCADCLRSGVVLVTAESDAAMDDALDALRAALAGPEPETSD